MPVYYPICLQRKTSFFLSLQCSIATQNLSWNTKDLQHLLLFFLLSKVETLRKKGQLKILRWYLCGKLYMVIFRGVTSDEMFLLQISQPKKKTSSVIKSLEKWKRPKINVIFHSNSNYMSHTFLHLESKIFVEKKKKNLPNFKEVNNFKNTLIINSGMFVLTFH